MSQFPESRPQVNTSQNRSNNNSNVCYVELPGEGIGLDPSMKKQIKATFSPTDNNVRTIVISQTVGDKEDKIRIDKLDAKIILDFLDFVAKTELGKIIDKTPLPARQTNSLPESIDIEAIKKYLEGSPQNVQEIISSLSIPEEIAFLVRRKHQLSLFKRMLEDDNAWKEVAKENNWPGNSEENCWQKFFESNKWIFGYGLDYKFMGVLQSQKDLSTGATDRPITDFLMSNNNFITFVELKTPSTKIWGEKAFRSGVWILTKEFYEAHSQILGQKAQGDYKYHNHSQLDIDDEDSTARAIDSKCILIIGRLPDRNMETADVYRKKVATLERFRRDSRNIEILTYDELYERAKFVVEKTQS